MSSSLASLQCPDFQYILRILNTNVDGKKKIWMALTAIKGVGRRFSILICQKANVSINKRAGELNNEEIDNITTILASPDKFNIPVWFFNRRRDIRDGVDKHLIGNAVDVALRDDLERLKRIRCNRGLRHFWGFRVRGQHTKTNGRYGLSAHMAKLKK